MSFKADFYEALVWLSLERIDLGEVVYEPSRSDHTCHIKCSKGKECDKINEYGDLIYTIPDFLVNSNCKYYFHVCYWESKETSHAKFWRTISELFDLKRYVPNSKSICVVFETSYKNGRFNCKGWYEDHLQVFKELFDGCVFFNHAELASEVAKIEADLKGVSGTQKIYNTLKKKNYSSSLFSNFYQHIKSPVKSSRKWQREKKVIWENERKFCFYTPKVKIKTFSAAPLRNAILQLVLISLLDYKNRDFTDLIESLQNNRAGVNDESEINFMKLLARLPITYRKKEYSFLVQEIAEDMECNISCQFSEVLEWFLSLWATNVLPANKTIIINALAKTKNCFAVSSQIIETLLSIETIIKDGSINLAEKDAIGLWNAFLVVPKNAKYNLIAELVISACQKGTYPLVREINEHLPSIKATRNDIRSLYSNRIAKNNSKRQKQIFLALVKLIPQSINFNEIANAYLLRKCKRIVGPQSAINPIEILIYEKLLSYEFNKKVILNNSAIEIQTLANDISSGQQAGTWRVATSFEKNGNVIPLFYSAMKDPGDCAHKTREFSGHLYLARYRHNAKGIRRSNITKGLAILEGAYNKEDRRQFYLSGYEVCNLSTLTQALYRLGLIKQSTNAKSVMEIDEVEIPMAAEPDNSLKINKK